MFVSRTLFSAGLNGVFGVFIVIFALRIFCLVKNKKAFKVLKNSIYG